jgi:hypothetical protein
MNDCVIKNLLRAGLQSLQVQGVEERKGEAYLIYVETFFDENNAEIGDFGTCSYICILA